MTEPAEQPAPAKPVRTWRPMVLGTAGILLVLGLAWLIGFALVTYRQTRSVAAAYGHGPGISAEEALRRLGGPRRACPRLRLLLRLPERLVPAIERNAAVYLLSFCGPGAVPELIKFLRHPDQATRHTAAEALGNMKTQVPDPKTAAALARALAAAVPVLEELLGDTSGQVRQAAASALKCIRGEEPAK